MNSLMFRRTIKFFVTVLLVISLVFVSAQSANTNFPRGTISATYCYGVDNLNYLNLDVNYYVYYLTFAGYPLSYMDVFGGLSYKFDQTASNVSDLGYRLGVQLVILFVDVRPTYDSGYLVYRNFDSCYLYVGVNYPVMWEDGFGGN